LPLGILPFAAVLPIGHDSPIARYLAATNEEDRMGFMDKAKKLAEQAQEKLDEAQKSFNKSSPPESPPSGVRYDEHGRPIKEETPAAATAPPSATPPPDPTAPIEGSTPAEAPAEEAPPPAPAPEEKPAGDANVTPDPFKPIQ
jgi:hypothetical protein